ARLRESRAAAEAIMARLDQGDNRLVRLNIEMMHASLMQLQAGEDGAAVTLSPQDAAFIARAIKDLTGAAKTDTDREAKIAARAREEERARIEAEQREKLQALGRRGGVSAETMAMINDVV